METLVVVPHHRNQYRSRGKGFRAINCRAQSGSPFLSPPPTKQSSLASPKTPSPPVKSQPAETKHFRRIVKSNTISLPIKFKTNLHKEGFFDEGLSFSELWAGPAYSNSPAPSALPIPKFSLCSKRSVSLDSPLSPVSAIDAHVIAKSAPSSPTRDHKGALNREIFNSADSATKTLRRILNLDVTD